MKAPAGGVPYPARFRGLDRDRRGYPVPVMVYRDSQGRPHFQINDTNRREMVIRADLCAICGQKLLRGRWFVGGPGSAFHRHGAYIDPPMHGECASYALKVCPYLAAPIYAKRIDGRTLPPGDTTLLEDQTMDPDRPDFFVAVMAVAQRKVLAVPVPGLPPVVRYIVPLRPYRAVTFWRAGAAISKPPGLPNDPLRDFLSTS